MMDFLLYELLAPVLQAVCYPIGWPLMKLLTLGRYPRRGSWFSDSTASTMTTMLGVVVVLVTVLALTGQFAVS